jgi:thymidylate synthase (FAD)
VRVDVLDHGYVELIGLLGDDWTPVRAARASFDSELKGEKADTKLLRYLMEHNHTSPFEMVELQWQVKAPIFVARQWVRHRTANWNEFSMRYADPERISDEGIDYYVPDKFFKQAEDNRQASSDEEVITEKGYSPDYYYRLANEQALSIYRSLIDRGVTREQARNVLPLSVYTKWIWKNDLHNTLHFLNLRLGEGAQPEIRQYAQAMVDIMKVHLPVIMELWEERRDS